jgi:phytoene dehydrogenase-like protein
VIANLLPEALSGLLDHPGPKLHRIQTSVDAGWSACMLYLQLRSASELPAEPFHLELIDDPDSAFIDGNHIFVSVSARDEHRGLEGIRTATVSTHVRPGSLTVEPAARVAAVQDRMMRTLARLGPEIERNTIHRLTASPRTWQRFTRRPRGLVGGVPRTVGLHNYRQIAPTSLARGLWLVGDSVFPGQSTLATALGGAATARAAMRSR